MVEPQSHEVAGPRGGRAWRTSRQGLCSGCRRWCSSHALHVLRPTDGRLGGGAGMKGPRLEHVDHLCHKHLAFQSITFGIRKTQAES